MRLTPFERQTIRETARSYFGEDPAAYLFGSRTQDDLRGGDIDLFIDTECSAPVEYAKKLAFRSHLKSRIGDKKSMCFSPDQAVTARSSSRPRGQG